MKGAHLRVVDFENNVVVLRTSDRTAMEFFGKGTQWCIADKNTNHYNSYCRTTNDIQYVLFDFNESIHSKTHRLGKAGNRRGVRLQTTWQETGEESRCRQLPARAHAPPQDRDVPSRAHL